MTRRIARIVLMVVPGFVVPAVATAASVRLAGPKLVAQAAQPPSDSANTPTGTDTAAPNLAPPKSPVLGVPTPARSLGSGNPLGTATPLGTSPPLGTPAPDATATTTNGLPNDATNGVPNPVTPENTGINVNTNADGTLTQDANPPTTPNGAKTRAGTGGLVAPFGATAKRSDGSTNSRNPLGTLGTTNRDVLGTAGSAYPTTGYFQQRGVETLPTIGRPLNGLSPTGINPQAAFYPSLPRAAIGVSPNSGYGVANGSRPTHMDARGVQRVD